MNNSLEAEQLGIIDNVSIEYAKNNLDYNKDSGVFLWLSGAYKGRIAGTKTKYGYIRIQINKSLIFAHRLAWAFENGEFPIGYIDHINQDRADNRISNLRSVSKIENSRNMTMKKKQRQRSQRGFMVQKEYEVVCKDRDQHEKKAFRLF